MDTAGTNRNKNYLFFTLIAIITLLAADLRFTAIYNTKVESPIRSDASEYFLYAYNLVHYGVYSKATEAYLHDMQQAAANNGQMTGQNKPGAPEPDAKRTPGYALFAALIMGKDSDMAAVDRVIFWQTLLSMLTLLFTYLISRTVLNRWWALVPMFLTAISPHLINANLYFLTESIFALSLVAFSFVLLQSIIRQNLALACLAGLLLGIAVMIRPTVQYFIVFALAIYALQPRPLAVKGKMIAVLAVSFLIIFASWSTRNIISTGQSSDSTLTKATLQHGMYPDFRYKDDPNSFGFPYRFDPTSKETVATVGTVLSEIQRRFTEEPLRHLQWYLWGKPTTLWSWSIIAGMGDSFVYEVKESPYFHSQRFRLTHTISNYSHEVMISLSIIMALFVWLPWAGSYFNQQQLWGLRVLSAMVVYYTTLHMVAAPFPRYAIPLRPINYMLAIPALYVAYELILKKQKTVET